MDSDQTSQYIQKAAISILNQRGSGQTSQKISFTYL